jgi:hypothetical protein
MDSQLQMFGALSPMVQPLSGSTHCRMGPDKPGHRSRRHVLGNLGKALLLAKTGEAHGYRAQMATVNAVSSPVVDNASVQSQLLNITKRLDEMAASQSLRDQRPQQDLRP